MHGVVCEHEVDDSFQVDVTSEIFVISSRESSADAVVGVHHTGDAVEPEAVEFEFLHVEPEVAEEEAENFVMPVVEQSTVPEFVLTFRPTMEIEVIRSVERIKTIKDVLASVRMNDIEQNGYAHSMGRVDEFFQFLRCAVTRTCGEETGNLVSKG